MTLTEKILARASGRKKTQAGDNIWVDADILMTHDVCGPGTIALFKEHFGSNAKVFDKNGIVIIPDHYIFTKDTHAQRNLKIIRDFAKEQDLTYCYNAFSEDYKGVCHIALAQEGHNVPGRVLFGTDSHTCTSGAFGMFATGIGNTDAAYVMGTGQLWVKVPETMLFRLEGELPSHIMAKDIILNIIGDIGVDGATYRALEFAGSTLKLLNMEERMTLCNMAIEAGGKNGLMPTDEVTRQYLQEVGVSLDYEEQFSDEDAQYIYEKTYDMSQMKSVVAKPHSPDNKAYACNLSDHPLDRAYIGSCTGGKLSDFQAAAEVLKGQKVKIDTFIVPATRKVEKQLEEVKLGDESLLEIFQKAGCHIGEPSCAACLGGPKDTFGRAMGEERIISTTNRNFPGRMGSKKSAVYLASPYTVSASALTGYITDPEPFVRRA